MFRLQVYHQQSKIHVTIQSQSRIVKNQTIQHRGKTKAEKRIYRYSPDFFRVSVRLC